MLIENERKMPLKVSTHEKLKLEKRKQLSKNENDVLDNVKFEEVRCCPETENVFDNATLVFSTGQGTFEFELAEICGR